MTGVLVHEWIEPSGGAEKVLDAMAQAVPSADIFCLWDDAPTRYPGHAVRESWLAHTPLRRHKAAALPMLPATWRRLQSETRYDWMLVSSHLFAHHARFSGLNADIPKLVYAHTPARYIWTPELDHRGNGHLARAVSSVLEPLDRRRAQEATAIAANSEFVRRRIQDTWERDATVIYPPVDIELIQSVADWRTQLSEDELLVFNRLPRYFVLGASRFIPYKRLDLVIRAGALANVPVVIAGHGPQEIRLRELAQSVDIPVHFVISPSDALLYALYQAARLFVFPAVEDFGIMPVEAMAAGCPVLVGNLGGAAETVKRVDNHGVLESLQLDELAEGIRDSTNRRIAPDRTALFSRARFIEQTTAWIRQWS